MFPRVFAFKRGKLLLETSTADAVAGAEVIAGGFEIDRTSPDFIHTFLVKPSRNLARNTPSCTLYRGAVGIHVHQFPL